MALSTEQPFLIEDGELTRFTDQTATEAMVPDGVKKIGLWAFKGCRNLQRVVLPPSVREIGYEAFKDCAQLTHITIPQGLKLIGSHAFSGCHKLADLQLPQGTVLGGRAMRGRQGRNLAEIPVDMAGLGRDEGSIDRQGDFLIHGTELLQYFGQAEAVDVPPGITAIKGLAFSGSATLGRVSIPQSVGYIHDHAFSACPALTTVRLPQGAISFGQGVFSGCSALSHINFSGGQSPSLFSGCVSLRTLELPPTVDMVSTNSFEGCTGLARITAPGATRIGRSWGLWASSDGEMVGNPSTAVVAPRVSPEAVEALGARINCLLGYLDMPQHYTPAQAAGYEACLESQQELLLEASCRKGIMPLARWYCQRGTVDPLRLSSLVEVARQGGHLALAALLMEQSHTEPSPGAITPAQAQLAWLLED